MMNPTDTARAVDVTEALWGEPSLYAQALEHHPAMMRSSEKMALPHPHRQAICQDEERE